MKILLIDVNCENSSTGDIVSLIHTHLDHDHDSLLCYGRGKAVHAAGVRKFGIDAETALHGFLARLSGYNGCFSCFSTRRLIRLIEEYQPDLVHIHELHAYFVNHVQLLEYLQKKNIPVIQTLHCEYSYTGKCGYAGDCEHWKTRCGNCPKIHAYVGSWFFDRTSAMFDAKKKAYLALPDLTLTVPSDWLKERVKQSFLKDRPVFTVHNGVNTDFFHDRDPFEARKALGLPMNQKIILAVAPKIMGSRKGGKRILEAAEKLKDQSFRFLLIGAEKPDAALQNVTLLPPVYDKEMLANYYSAADVFVLASSRETFSMTCAEALCSGTRIAGFRCGAPETIFEEPYARFADYGDIDALADLILAQLNYDHAETAAYGMRRFSTAAMVQNYQDLYDRVLSA